MFWIDLVQMEVPAFILGDVVDMEAPFTVASHATFHRQVEEDFLPSISAGVLNPRFRDPHMPAGE